MANSPPTPRKLDVPATDSLRLKDPSQFRYIGKEGTNIVDGFDITTGRATYGQDVRLPGQKYAVVARPPVMGGKVASYDATETKKVPGVVQIVEIPAPVLSHGVPAVGRNRRHRRQHLGGDPGPQGAEDRLGRRPARDLRFAGLSRGDGGDRPPAGDGPAQRRRLRRRLRGRGQESRGRVLHPAQSPMRRWSRPSATCRIVDGKAEVWTSVQSPQAAHDLVAKYLGLPRARTSRST